jgi:hypothetical protein
MDDVGGAEPHVDGDVPVISMSRLVITTVSSGGCGRRNILSFFPFPHAFKDNGIDTLSRAESSTNSKRPKGLGPYALLVLVSQN